MTGGKIKFWKRDGFLQKTLLFVLSFLIPAIVLLIVLKSRGFYPFGDKTLFIMDMRDQYMEFFASLRYLFRGDDSLFFSWSRSMGGNYLGLFAYYVASPLSFLTVLFPLEKLPVAILFLTVLKIGLCGLSFAWYASYLWAVHADDDRKAWSSLLILIFSVSYALISYNMVYSMCLMWLDGVILLPMVLLGVEKILRGEKGLHYVLSLAAIFICNYYTGYMVGLFTAIYMVYRVICLLSNSSSGGYGMGASVKEYLWKTLRFTCATFLAFGLSAPLILPVAKDLMQGKLASSSYMPDTKTNFEFRALFGKLKNGVYDSITNSGLPAIYCGYLMIALLLVFFVLRKISIREKVGALLILALLVCSLYYTKLDIAWHGFQYPTWFPYRYAFLVSFFMIYMAFRGACGLWASFGTKKAVLPLCLAGIVTLVISVELGINAKALFAGLEAEFGYSAQQDYEAFLKKEKTLVEQVSQEDDSFYRTNVSFEYSKNDAMLLGYHGLTHYSSTYHAGINALTPKLGIAQSHFWNSGYGSNAMLDSLFAVKYIMDDAPVPSSYEATAINEGAAAYRNPSALSIAYSAPVVDTHPNLETGDPFQNQNNYLNALAGTELSYFTELQYSIDQPDSSWSYLFTADSDNPVYLYMQAGEISWADVYVNDQWVGNYFSTETSCSLYLGSFQPGQEVVVRVVPNSMISVNFAAIGELHMELLTPALEQLQQGNMEITRHAAGKLSGKINVADNQMIVTSIPYDSGWTVKIDGKKVDVEKYADTFLAVKAEKGEHKISFSYVSPGFGMGMVLFVVAALILGFYILWITRAGGDLLKRVKK